ncbi:MAG: TetR/AcrR family transcriptional regulator [Acidimicrobiales bacterium]
MTARSGRPLLSQPAIVARALEIVDDTGMASLSMRSLANDLGVSAPALYDHVDSKESLLRLLAREGYANLAARWEHLDTNDFAAWIRATSHSYVVFARERPGLFGLMFLYRPAFVLGPGEVEDDVATEVFQQGLEVIERAVDDGLLGGATPLEFSLALWSTMHGAATVQSMSPEMGKTDWLVDLIVDGLLAGWRPRINGD